MNAVLILALLGALGNATLDGRIEAEQGAVGLRLGYRYVPSLFYAESAAAHDPVISSYFGSPAAGLRFTYFATADIPVMLDLEWGTQRHELASEGWVQTHAVAVGVSGGYKPDLDFALQPYGLIGADFVPVVVTDKIKSGAAVNSFSGTFGLHAALGLLAPALIAPLPWLMPMLEARYTYSAMTQRGRTYHLLGASLMVGLELRFDTARRIGGGGSL